MRYTDDSRKSDQAALLRRCPIFHSHGCCHFGNLAIVQETYDQIGYREGRSIDALALLSSALHEKLHDAIKEWQEDLGSCATEARPNPIVVG